MLMEQGTRSGRRLAVNEINCTASLACETYAQVRILHLDFFNNWICLSFAPASL